MKIKKFVGASMSECLLKVKRELGEDAVILDSRKLARGGPFSFMLSDQVEVIAATEAASEVSRGVRRPKSSYEGAEKKRPDGGRDGRYNAGLGQSGLPNSDVSLASGEVGPTGPTRPVSAAEFALISDDIKGLKDTVQQITDHLKYGQLPSLPAELERLQGRMLENGVEERVAAGLTQEMALQFSGAELEDGALLQRALYERLGKRAPVMALNPPYPPLEKGRGTRLEGGGRARVVALVGPTGVGKTTTLAKMATHPNLYGRKRVALVSADTYRIAAVEQLKTFASIANLPMEAVYRPADIRRAIDRYRDYDVVLIDTAGRSQNDRGQMNDLSAFLEFAQADDVYLVLSISTRLDDQLDVLSKFQAAQPRRLIFTKLDETTSYGMILNVCCYAARPGKPQAETPALPVSLLTCGQNVPDDIIAPNQAQIVRLLADRTYFRQELVKG